MSHRLLASHSALFTKGVAQKAGDWKNLDVTDEGRDDNKMLRRSESVASMASLQKQLNASRPSSPSLASSNIIKSRSYPALLNAIRDDKDSSISHLEQHKCIPTTAIDLVSVKAGVTSNIHPNNNFGRCLWSANTRQFPREASTHTIRSRPSMPNLSSLVEEKEEEESFKPVFQRLSSLFDNALKTNHQLKVYLANSTDRGSCPETTTKEAVSPAIRSRLSMPNLSSLVKEEEAVLFKQYPVSSTNNENRLFVVDTFAEKVRRQIDLRNISSSDLTSLKQDDPFMYYSIPAVRNASWQCEHIDLPSLQSSDLSFMDSSIYERKSCISFEPWINLSPSDVTLDETDGYFIPTIGGGFFDFNMDDDGDDREDEDPINDFLLMSLAGGMV
ncbi:hypothetical protein ACHAW6_005805 [Cyclotella cf. meneghiniana]